jgi:FMN phosphatase YigB (HAD superfamily)
VTAHPLKAIALDFGHTLIDERVDILAIPDHRETHLMPGVRPAVEGLSLPIAVWANTRRAVADDVRRWLERAGLSAPVRWVVTSVDAGARKPAREFFEFALRQMGMTPGDVLFVGNQRNSDIAGGEGYGIRTVYLSDPIYRSPDDAPCTAEPTFTIATLADLPRLVARLTSHDGTNPEPRTANPNSEPQLRTANAEPRTLNRT